MSYMKRMESLALELERLTAQADYLARALENPFLHSERLRVQAKAQALAQGLDRALTHTLDLTLTMACGGPEPSQSYRLQTNAEKAKAAWRKRVAEEKGQGGSNG